MSKDWAIIDGANIADTVTGGVIIGAEPIDYPCTDGVVLYIERDGKCFAVEIGSDGGSFCLKYLHDASKEYEDYKEWNNHGEL